MKQLLIILFITLIVSCNSTQKTDLEKIKVNDSNSFIIAANFPYFAISPHSIPYNDGGNDFYYWNKTLEIIKNSGFNTVIIKVPWNLHEKEIGNIDLFIDNLDLIDAVKLISQHNLKIILDISPQSYNILNGGGLPSFLQKNTSFNIDNNDNKIAIRTNDSDFLKQYFYFIDSIIDNLYPYFFDNESEEKTIISIIVENEINKINTIWESDSKYIGSKKPKMNQYIDDIIYHIIEKGIDLPFYGGINLERFFPFTDYYDILPLFKGHKIQFDSDFPIISQNWYNSPFMFELTENNPDDIINAYVAGAKGIILDKFTGYNLSNDSQGWQRENFTNKGLKLSSPYIKGAVNNFSTSTTSARIEFLSKWISSGDFPNYCTRNFHYNWVKPVTFSSDYYWTNYTIPETAPTITWQCRDNYNEINYINNKIKLQYQFNPQLVQIISGETIYYKKFNKYSILILSNKNGDDIKISTGSKNSIITKNIIYKYIKDINKVLTIKQNKLNKLRISNGTDIIWLITVPKQELRNIHFIPDYSLLITGTTVVTEFNGNLKTKISDSPVYFEKITEKEYPKLITSFTGYPIITSSITINNFKQINENTYSDYFDVNLTEGWLEGKTFDSYATMQPYNYKSGFFTYKIFFLLTNTNYTNIKIPSVSGIFSATINGHYLGIFQGYGNNITIPVKSQNIIIGNNNIVLQFYPTGNFPFSEPFFSKKIENNILHSTGFPNIKNTNILHFYKKLGTKGEGGLFGNSLPYIFNRNWFYINKLWGERVSLLYKGNITHEYTQSALLPIYIDKGQVVWLIKEIPISQSMQNNFISGKLSFSGKNIWIRVYLNGKLYGNILKGAINSGKNIITMNNNPILFNINSVTTKKIILSVAVLSFGNGELDNVSLNLLNSGKEQWISSEILEK